MLLKPVEPATPEAADPRYGDPARPLFYVVDWLPPDFGAVGQYAVIFARQFARAGRHVYLVGLTSGEPSVTHETCGAGVLEIRKLSAPRYNKLRAAQRLMWTFKTNFRLAWEVVRHPKSYKAAVLFTGSPPFMLHFALLIKIVRKVRLIYRITDFFPEVIIANRKAPSRMLEVLRRATWFLRRQVDLFEALGLDQRRILSAHGIDAARIVLKRDLSPVVLGPDVAPARRPPELQGRFTLLYSGNFGVAHDDATVVNGLIRHHRSGSDRFGLWLNASGSKVADIVEALTRVGAPFVKSAPVALGELPQLLLAADVHLITLRPQFAGIVLPSKIYACLESRRPILFVGPEESDIHLLCADRSGLLYERVDPGDEAGFCAALDRMAERLPKRIGGKPDMMSAAGE